MAQWNKPPLTTPAPHIKVEAQVPFSSANVPRKAAKHDPSSWPLATHVETWTEFQAALMVVTIWAVNQHMKNFLASACITHYPFI